MPASGRIDGGAGGLLASVNETASNLDDTQRSAKATTEPEPQRKPPDSQDWIASLGKRVTTALPEAVTARSSVAGRESREIIYQDIQAMFPGGAIDRAELEGSLAFLEACYQRMVAQYAAFPDDYPGIDPKFSSELVVVKSDTPNAFAGVIIDKASRRVTGSISVVTSSMLGEFLHAKCVPELGLRERLLAVVGVLAHELAHSVDKADPEGIELRHGAGVDTGASIATELRTDCEAQKLLRRANLPLAALYYSSMILKQGRGTAERLQSLFSTHPEVTFRSACQRGVITPMRLTFGDAAPEIELSAEAAARIDAETRPFFQAKTAALPKDLGELDTMLRRLPLAKLDEAEFNAAVLWFDQHLATHPDLDPADPTLNGIRRKIMGYPQPVAPTKEALQRLFEKAEIEGLDTLIIRPHAEYLETLPFYRDPRLLKGVVEMRLPSKALGDEPNVEFKLQTRPTESSNFTDYWDALAPMSLAHDMSRGFSREVIGGYLEGQRAGAGGIRRIEGAEAFLLELPSISNGKSFLAPRDFLGYAADFHGRVIGPFVEQSGLFDPAKSLFCFDYRYAVPTHESRSYWRGLLATHGSGGTAREAKAILESIWENRGMWATLEFLSNRDAHLDWDLIGETLNIPRERLKHDLQDSFKAFIDQKIERAGAMPERFEVSALTLPRKPPVWLGSKLDHFLRKKIEAIGKGAEKSAAKCSILTRYYDFNPNQRTKALARTFATKLEARPPASVSQIYALWADTAKEVLGREGRSIDDPSDKVPIVWSGLEAAGVDPKLRRSFADDLLQSTSFAYLNKFGSQNMGGVYRALQSTGGVEDLPGLFERVRQSEQAKWSRDTKAYAGYAENTVKQVVVALTSDLTEDCATTMATRSTPELLNYLFRLAKSLSFAFERNEFNHSRDIAASFLAEATKRALSTSEKLEAFNSITEFAANADTDGYFREAILPELVAGGDLVAIREVLLEGRIKSSALQIELASVVLDSLPPSTEVERVLEALHRLVPSASSAKDHFLEDLAWQRDLSGDALETLIEKAKSSNWRKLDPKPLVYNAAVTEVFRMMSPRRRARLVEYLIVGPKAEAVLDELLRELKREATTTYERAAAVALRAGYSSEQALDLKLAKAKSAIVTMVNNSDPIQRVPLTEYLLTIGDDCIANQPVMMRQLLERHLKITPGSPESAVLNAYLDVIPPHERNLTISYLLINSRSRDGEEMNLRSLFEVFGTAGIKFGQLAAVWDVFGPEYKKQLEGLFDNAAPMSKREIERLLKREMGDDYPTHIKRLIKVLGSASIKTVVLAELTDGREVALMVQRPNAEGQTRSHIKNARKFLERLAHYSVQSSNPIFDPLIASVEHQIPDELDQAQERRNTRLAQSIVGRINDSFGTSAEGWQVEVPKITEDLPACPHVFAMEAVKGVSAKTFLKDPAIPKAERELVGRLMTRTALQTLFRHGCFDPDRHPGNWIIDAGAKKIHFIDAGQLVRFHTERSQLRSDGRLALARFLHAISKADVRAIVEAALEMRPRSDLTEVDIAEVAKAIQGAIRAVPADQPQSETLKAIVTALYGSGVKLDDHYTFGGLKGLLTLAGSGYVSSAEFAKILSEEITLLFLKKAPAVLAPRWAKALADGLDATWKGLRGERQ